ncbi:hypothetical protein ACOMHN_002959 [Nucella lapillus]
MIEEATVEAHCVAAKALAEADHMKAKATAEAKQIKVEADSQAERDRAKLMRQETLLKKAKVNAQLDNEEIDRRKAREKEVLESMQRQVEIMKSDATLKILEKYESDIYMPDLPGVSLVETFINGGPFIGQLNRDRKPPSHIGQTKQCDTVQVHLYGATTNQQRAPVLQGIKDHLQHLLPPVETSSTGVDTQPRRSSQLQHLFLSRPVGHGGKEVSLSGHTAMPTGKSALSQLQHLVSLQLVGRGDTEVSPSGQKAMPTGESALGSCMAHQPRHSNDIGQFGLSTFHGTGPTPVNVHQGGQPGFPAMTTTTTTATITSPLLAGHHSSGLPERAATFSNPLRQAYTYPLRYDAQPFVSSFHPASAEPPQQWFEQRQLTPAEEYEAHDKAVTQTLADAVTLNRLSVQEPSVFKGDAMEFPMWRSAFSLLIERQNIPRSEKLLYLQKYVGGVAADALKGYFIMKDSAAFEQALKVLDERYGSSFVIARAFRDKLDSWPVVKNRDSVAMRSLAEFMQQSVVASKVVGQMGILDDALYQKRLIDRLPDWISHKWNRHVSKIKSKQQRYPTFEELAEFIKEEADIACEPVFGTANKISSPVPTQPFQSSGILPPPGVFDEADLYARKQWRKVQHLSNEFWRLWRKDFLMTLHVRRKWQKRQPNVEVGDIVILRDDGVFRADWRLARGIEVYPGQDGLVRSCKVRVAMRTGDDKLGAKTSKTTTELIRPVIKMTFLVKA